MMKACNDEHRAAARRARDRFCAGAGNSARRALDVIIELWDAEIVRPRTEPWFRKRYWVCTLEQQYTSLPDRVRREPCAECGRTVVVLYDGTCHALVYAVVWICTDCANTRASVHGAGWRNVA